MNVPSQITLYDLLCMLVPGFVILWFVNFFGIAIDNATVVQSLLLAVLCYPIGMVYHKLMESMASGLKLTKNTCMIKRAIRFNKNKLPQGIQDKYNVLFDDEIVYNYDKAYYTIAQNNCLMNIPVLEAQTAFLRNAFLLIVGSIIKLNCSTVNCGCVQCVTAVLFMLLIGDVVCWFLIQFKIYILVFEGYIHLSELRNGKDETSTIQPIG